jgi:hypothetical protein
MKRLFAIMLVLSFAFGASAQKLIWKADEILLPGGKIDSLMSDTSFTDATDTDVPTAAAVKAYVGNNAGSGNSSFDSDRQILRVPTAGDNIGGSTVQDFLNYFYFAPPTISLNVSGGTLFEVGTSNVLTLSGSTSNPGGSTLSAGVLQRTSPTPVNDVNTFNASTSYSEGVTFAPTQGGTADYTQLSYTFQASQDWEGGGQSGTATSPSRTVQAVYPVLYGVSSTDLHSSGTAYQVLTKLVQTEGNKQVTLNGTGFLWYAVPTTWVDSNLSSILDQNGFNVTASFSALLINVGSSGLTNNWTQEYRVYKSNNQATVTNATYTFNR